MVFHMGFAPGFALSSKPTVLKGSIMSGLCFYILPSKQLYFTDINGLSSGGITQSIILVLISFAHSRRHIHTAP